MSHATIALIGDEVSCVAAGALDARFALADAGPRLEAWARRYDRASSYNEEGELATIGIEMFAWLDSTNGWASNWLATAGDHILEIRAGRIGSGEEHLLLDAPWELLVGPKGPLAADDLHLLIVYRRIGKPENPFQAEFADFKLMFMAASPGDPGDLEFEAEETAILDATMRLPLHLTVEETGSLEFLSERLSTEGPFEALHLSCHGTIDPERGPVIALEDAAGNVDLASPGRIADGLGARKPQLLFLSACRTAEYGRVRGGTPWPGHRDAEPRRDAGAAPMLAAPLARQMAEMVANVVGWDGSVYDADAIAFARHFYRELARAASVPRAAAVARKALLREKAEARSGRHWHLARVYVGAGGGGPLCDNRKSRRPRATTSEKVFLDQERGLVPVASRRAFVGRRRAIQALLRAYRGGSSGALIHGMGALGKSSLAARAVSRMPTLKPVVIFERYDAMAVFDRICDSLPPLLRQSETAQWREKVDADTRILSDALESWLDCPFAAQPILLVIDDLERILETPRPSDISVAVKLEYRPVVAAILSACSRSAGESRLLLTSRYDFRLLDSYGQDLAEPLHRVPLQRMGDREQVKQWRAASRIADREADLTKDGEALLERAFKAAGGNPGLQAILTKPILADEFSVAETAIGQIEFFLKEGVPPPRSGRRSMQGWPRMRRMPSSTSSTA